MATNAVFSVINRGNGWEDYKYDSISEDFFEALERYREVVAANPGNYYLLSAETSNRARAIYSSEFGEGIIR